jgi:hypothetical protein
MTAAARPMTALRAYAAARGGGLRAQHASWAAQPPSSINHHGLAGRCIWHEVGCAPTKVGTAISVFQE